MDAVCLFVAPPRADTRLRKRLDLLLEFIVLRPRTIIPDPKANFVVFIILQI